MKVIVVDMRPFDKPWWRLPSFRFYAYHGKFGAYIWYWHWQCHFYFGKAVPRPTDIK